MSLTLYTSFYPEVLPYVPDVSDPAALNAIRNAAIEFCKRTLLLQTDLDTIDGAANEPNYLMPIPGGYVLADVIDAWYNGVPLTAKSVSELKNLYQGVDWRSQVATPLFYYTDDKRQLRLVPMPDKDLLNGLSVRVALAPSRTSKGVDSLVFEDWSEAIAAGARARLYATPGQTYYNEPLSAAYRKTFDDLIGDAARQANRSQTRAKVTANARPFA